jgi:acyl-CoA dehydrogenase
MADLRLNERERALVASAQALAASSGPAAAQADRRREFPAAAYEAAAEAGLVGIAVPAEFGGTGVSSVAQAEVIEALAHGCAAVVGAVIGNGVQAALTILHGESGNVRERILGPLVRGETQVAFAITESSAGSDAAALKCRATRDGSSWRLEGEKLMINRASLSSFAIVFATVDPALRHKGIAAFLVDLRQAGVSIGPRLEKMGQRGLPTESIHLDGALVPDEDRLSEVGGGFALMMKVINRARTMVAANAVGRMSVALAVALAHVQEREQFGKPLSALPSVRTELADMAIAVEAARCLTRHAARALDDDDREQARLAAMAKALATGSCIDVCRAAMLLCGGMAYTEAFPLERMLRDAMAGQIVDGANPVQKQVIAAEILKAGRPGA